MKLKKSPNRRRSQTKHIAVIDAAAALVGELGYERCTIEGVATLAGVGKQTIYRWWPSKHALYLETYKQLVADVKSPDVRRTTIEDALHLFLCQLFQCYRKTPAGKILTGLIAESTRHQDVLDAIEQGLFIERKSLLADPIREAVKSGALDKSVNVEFAVEAIVALIWKRLLTEPNRLNAAFSKIVVATALRTGPA